MGTSNEGGICYIETASLDGETNLKTRTARKETAELFMTDGDAKAFRGVINCEHPNNSLYTFSGNMQLPGGETVSLDPVQLLLRGSKLCNTQYVYGTPVFTGRDTKVMRNLTRPPSKRSSLDKAVDKQVFIIFAVQFTLSLICAIASYRWSKSEYERAWYLLSPEERGNLKYNYAADAAKRFFTFVILFNTMVPISLIISIEIVKVFQAFLINMDPDMYHRESKTNAKARTSSLNEELGQVEYIFSDKTGTLTQNRMDFKFCSIGGVMYAMDPAAAVVDDEPSGGGGGGGGGAGGGSRPPTAVGEDLAVGDDATRGRSSLLRGFFTLMAICHTVVPDNSKDDPAAAAAAGGDAPGGARGDLELTPRSSILAASAAKVPELPEIQAESPDEAALVQAAARFGFVFTARGSTSVTFFAEGSLHKYEILNTCVFNSTRKRMSVVCRCPDGRIRIFTKGADNVIMERLKPGCPHADETAVHLTIFAKEGLRTLCLAYREVDEDEYASWNRGFQEALCSITDRDGMLAASAELIETNLTLLGATGIEDKLQDGVPEAIHQLALAGMKIWVLTGDKQETAINIGYSCRLITNDMEKLFLTGSNVSDAQLSLRENGDKLETDAALRAKQGGPRHEYALIVTGETLDYVMRPENVRDLVKLAIQCKAVICCRVSPLQKALVVTMVRKHQKCISLAIGDGANDVSMIRAAHLGIGISGNEGMQAALASDYSIAQFRFLLPLLLVHGRWSYKRVSKLILFSFYKNMAFAMTQFWYAFYSGFSGQTLYDGWYLAFFNVTSTALPVMVFALFDQDVGRTMSLRWPELYSSGQRRESFNAKLLFRWVLLGMVHSVALFYVPLLAMESEILRTNGVTMGMWGHGTVGYTCALIVVNLKIALDTRFWSVYNFLAVSLTILYWFVFLIGYTGYYTTLSADVHGVFSQLARSAQFWFTLLICIFVCLLPDFAVKAWYRNFGNPQPVHVLQEAQKFKIHLPRADDPEGVKHPKDASASKPLLEEHGRTFL